MSLKIAPDIVRILCEVVIKVLTYVMNHIQAEVK